MICDRSTYVCTDIVSYVTEGADSFTHSGQFPVRLQYHFFFFFIFSFRPSSLRLNFSVSQRRRL